MSSSHSHPGRRRGLGFVTPNACTECRRKRAKCDGKTPCGRCESQDLSDQCVYELPTRQSKDEMRQELARLRQYQEQSKKVFGALAANRNSSDILDQLRSGEDLGTILRRLEGLNPASSVAISPPYRSVQGSTGSTSGPSNQPFRFEDWLEQSPIQTDFDFSRPYGQDVILGDETDAQGLLDHHGPKQNNESWTTVTSDGALVEHLLALYFCWEYPIFATVSQEHFMEDFRRGNARFCSSLLVNALLALACRFSDRPTTRSDPNDPTTAGDQFFAEALRLLDLEQDRHLLTTIQALGVMSIRQASCGRIAESSYLSAQSIRLAVEMGLHVETATDDEDEDDSWKHVCEATFWGALSLNEMLSLCTGSLPHLSRNINFPPKPAIIKHLEESVWAPYTDDGIPMDQHFFQPSNIRSVYNTFCELSERVHNALYTLYSPDSKVNSAKLVALYNQYIQWYDTVPESLRLGQNYTPQVLFAHLFYHSTTLLLFQPFINLKLTTSAVLPREVCYQSAAAITGIVRSYSTLYTLRRTPSFVPFFVLTSAIIHQLAMKEDPSSAATKANLTQSISDLQAMAECHGFAQRALDALRYLSKRWGVEGVFDEDNEEKGELENKRRSFSGVMLDPFSPDVSILETLQSLQPVLRSKDPPLFNPFPMQGLPLVVSGTEMEKEGFTVAENNKGKKPER